MVNRPENDKLQQDTSVSYISIDVDIFLEFRVCNQRLVSGKLEEARLVSLQEVPAFTHQQTLEH